MSTPATRPAALLSGKVDDGSGATTGRRHRATDKVIAGHGPTDWKLHMCVCMCIHPAGKNVVPFRIYHLVALEVLANAGDLAPLIATSAL